MLKALLALPTLTHTLLAAVYTVAVAAALYALPPVPPAFIAAGFVWVYFCAREAGQHEHDLKNLGVKGFLAWLGATFMFKWFAANVVQWGVAALAAVVVGVLLFFYKFNFVGF